MTKDNWRNYNMDTDQLNDYELFVKYNDVQELYLKLCKEIDNRHLLNKPYVMWSHERPANTKLQNDIKHIIGVE